MTEIKHILVHRNHDSVIHACRMGTALMSVPDAIIWSQGANCPRCIELCDAYNVAYDIGEAFDGSR